MMDLMSSLWPSISTPMVDVDTRQGRGHVGRTAVLHGKTFRHWLVDLTGILKIQCLYIDIQYWRKLYSEKMFVEKCCVMIVNVLDTDKYHFDTCANFVRTWNTLMDNLSNASNSKRIEDM